MGRAAQFTIRPTRISAPLPPPASHLVVDGVQLGGGAIGLVMRANEGDNARR